MPYADLVEELIALTIDEAAEADCVAEIEHLRTIVKRGTSAHRQRAAYQAAVDGGADHDEALNAVVDMLLDLTREH